MAGLSHVWFVCCTNLAGMGLIPCAECHWVLSPRSFVGELVEGKGWEQQVELSGYAPCQHSSSAVLIRIWSVCFCFRFVNKSARPHWNCSFPPLGLVPAIDQPWPALPFHTFHTNRHLNSCGDGACRWSSILISRGRNSDISKGDTISPLFGDTHECYHCCLITWAEHNATLQQGVGIILSNILESWF